VREQFGQIKHNMNAMVNSTQESAAAITRITDSVNEQNQAISNISDEIGKIARLSGDLKTRFAQ
jgi:methyl-accepting chemotaxis protein